MNIPKVGFGCELSDRCFHHHWEIGILARFFHGNGVTVEDSHGAETGQKANSVRSSKKSLSGVKKRGVGEWIEAYVFTDIFWISAAVDDRKNL